MKKSLILVALTAFLLFLIPFVTADTDLSTLLEDEAYCSDDAYCLDLCSYYAYTDIGDCYCDPSTTDPLQLSCFLADEELVDEDNLTVDEETTPTAATVPSTDISKLQAEISTLKELIISEQGAATAIKSKLSTTETELISLQTRMFTLQQQVETIEGSYAEELNTFSTGLAGLQQTVETTQENLSNVNQQLEEGKSTTTFLSTIVYMLLIIAAVAGAGFYLVKRKTASKKIHPHVLSYITEHIKQGKKYPHIKENLLQAGWQEEHIEDAFKQTMKKNYQDYKSGSKLPLGGADKRKIYGIMGISVALVIGILFVLSGSVGKAVFTKQLVDGVEGGRVGEITYDIECTPPHILTPERDACCLDYTQDGICDYLEERELGEMIGGVCTDNYQCNIGDYCINSKCAPLTSIYTGKGDCSKMCHIYSAKILTSDGEAYSIRPKMGSYTAAGALEWKVMEPPMHCKGEPPVLPIKIIKKRTGEIISEEVITLQRRVTSPALTHPDFALDFTLEAQYIYQSCPD
ncbi:MAG: hypothetical protein KKH52_01535 [Nanoarchaeota archaeon]|nr:hypothetical protein [Nanoarchaeota archaeon]